MTDSLPELLDIIISWISAHAWWIFGGSVLMFVVSLLVIRVLIVRIPEDYFVHDKPLLDDNVHPVWGIIILIVKNVVGFILVILGLIMSLPGVVGQGILTILIGLSLMNFPGKRVLQLKIVKQEVINNTINNIRIKANKLPLILPE